MVRAIAMAAGPAARGLSEAASPAGKGALCRRSWGPGAGVPEPGGGAGPGGPRLPPFPQGRSPRRAARASQRALRGRPRGAAVESRRENRVCASAGEEGKGCSWKCLVPKSCAMVGLLIARTGVPACLLVLL